MTKILFLSGTSGSNAELAEMLSEVARGLGAECELLVLSSLEMPLFTTEAMGNGNPAAAIELTDKLKAADALVLLAPEYNGSIPPTVSNAIAWMSVASPDFREAFNGKFAIVGTCSGGGGHKVVEAMRMQLNHLGMIVLARTFTTNKQKPQSPESANDIFTQLLGLIK